MPDRGEQQAPATQASDPGGRAKQMQRIGGKMQNSRVTGR